MAKTTDLTRGKASRVLLAFYFPMLISNLLQHLYTMADTAIVGKGLGDHALAAVGNLSGLMWLVFGFAQGITNGFSVIISQHFGAREEASLRKAIATSISLSLLLSVLMTGLCLVFLKKILVLMQTDPLILTDSLTYAAIMIGALIVTMAYNLCSCILRALGDSRTPFVAIVVSSVLNIVLDCLFIFGLQFGVAGAAAATVISQAVSVLICADRLWKTKEVLPERKDFVRDGHLSLLLMKNGLPLACMNSLTAVGCMIVQGYVNSMGVVFTSAYSACNKYVNFFMLPSITFGYAVAAFTGQNYGAWKTERIREGVRVGVAVSVVSYVALGAVMVFFPGTLAGFLLSGAEAIAWSKVFLRMCGVMLLPLNLLFIYRNAVQGMGRPLVPLCSGILEMALRIFVIVVFLPRIGFSATAWAEGAAWVGAFLMNFGAYLHATRQWQHE